MSFVSFLVIIVVLVALAQSVPDYYKDYHWCGKEFKYLDDTYCVKQFPSSFDREWSCPVPILSEPPAGDYFPDTTLDKLKVDVTSLSNIANEVGANVCIILTKRVRESPEAEIKLYNKYFCAGESSATEPWETWSSSKVFAMANAAGHLRTNETTCSAGFGLPSTTIGNYGVTPLGDLSTIISSYDKTHGYSSNGVSSYFHDIGWRGRLNSLVNSKDWLIGDGIGTKPFTLGGNYGVASPTDLSLTLTNPVNGKECAADKDPWPVVYDNSLSSLAAAELTRRLVLTREVKPEYRFPGMTWEDAKEELYGAENCALFPGLQWGGMSTDSTIFLQYALNITEVERASQGQFRIFSKSGAGYSTIRYRGEMISNAYACLPSKDAPNGGYEFTVSVRGSIPDDTSLLKVQEQVFGAMSMTMDALMNGRLK